MGRRTALLIGLSAVVIALVLGVCAPKGMRCTLRRTLAAVLYAEP